MTDIILVGCNGKMGQVVCRIAETDPEVRVSCGIDISGEKKNGFPVFTEFNSDVCGSVIIDFSHPSSLTATLEYALEKKIPAVIATTGFSREQTEEISRACDGTAIFFSANMSIGINLLISLVRQAAQLLEDSFDIEIVEKHHNQKIDAPSGTALAIADAVNEVSAANNEYVYDRHGVRKKRGKHEIGLHSVRGGTIVGEHSVIFAGQDEVLEISHSARSKEIFAVGAVKAAKYMLGKPAGMYNMRDLVAEMQNK